jgi:formate dehydrogenase iron-sulfur subunit
MMAEDAGRRAAKEQVGILVDVTRCTGCERCVDACVEANELDPVAAGRDRAITMDGLSANRLCTLVALENGRFARKSCMHCDDPSCVAACLVGGITRSANGAVVYEADKCIGCRYCMLACPYHIPRYEWDRTMPLMKKCNLCFDRVNEGRTPACVAACPHQALTFGQRDRLLAEAWSRVMNDQAGYLPRVWGQSEWGGSSVLYISDVELSGLGFSGADDRGIASVTDPIIHRTPHIGLGVAATLTGLSWVLKRRDQLMNAPIPSEGEKGSEEENG